MTADVSTRRRSRSGIVHEMADLGVATLCGRRLAEPWEWTDDRITCDVCLSRSGVRRTICPDGGTCHHTCLVRSTCFRVRTCGPLSGVYPDDEWPVGVT